MTTLEQVEKLCAMANISYEEARSALNATNGDFLEAVIALEKQGKIQAPTGGGSYSSAKTTDSNSGSAKEQVNSHEYHDTHCKKGKSFGAFLKDIGDFCFKIFRKSNANTFDVLKGGEIKAAIPITVLVLLLIFTTGVILPLIIIGLFFGFRYRFAGPDFNNNPVNDAMNSAADAAENLKNSIKN